MSSRFETIASLRDVSATPPIRRSSMRYREIDKRAVRLEASKTEETASRVRIPWWDLAAFIRRTFFAALVIFSATAGGALLTYILAERKVLIGLHIPLILIFVVLFGWISSHFWVIVFGFVTLMSRWDPFLIRTRFQSRNTIPDDALTAVIMPVFSEDPASAFAAVGAVYKSIQRAGELDHFHFYVLSDSPSPDQWVLEEITWHSLCEKLGASGRLFYRRRRNRIRKKSGNIADFCRRWGSLYRYMVVLDSDSLMSGRLIADMVKTMECRPDIGILQTVPKAVRQDTLYARIQQFANHLYGPLYMAGMHFWQLGDAAFWGHNAIIRMEPFMKYCALPILRGPRPFQGEILSHDFVEAALMRRAGYGVWLTYAAEGSYEEVPRDIIEELDRDRRWCAGNVQHLSLLGMKGISSAHRVLFIIGNMLYFSSFLWFFFLFWATVSIVSDYFHEPSYFPAGHSLFPDWPVEHRSLSLSLAVFTAVFLLLPKFLSVVFAKKSGRIREFGGTIRTMTSVLLETLFSVFFAPPRMLFQTQFYYQALRGRRSDWRARFRRGGNVSLAAVLKIHAPAALLAILWGVVIYVFKAPFLLGFSLVFVPVVLAAPIAALTGRAGMGRAFRRFGLFLNAEEIQPSPEIVSACRLEKHLRLAELNDKEPAFLRAVKEPFVNALHQSMLCRQPRRFAPEIARQLDALAEKVVRGDVGGLSDSDKLRLLYDPGQMARFSEDIYGTPSEGSVLAQESAIMSNRGS